MSVRCAQSVFSDIGHKHTIEAFVLALHNAQFMNYTSSKQRRESYTILVYSDKQHSLQVLVVVVVACAKLNQYYMYDTCNYLEFVAFTELKNTLQNQSCPMK